MRTLIDSTQPRTSFMQIAAHTLEIAAELVFVRHEIFRSSVK
ncbi:hypothetical protein [Dactylosporangium cerinum]